MAKILFIIAIGCVLLPILVFPLSSDHSIYLRGGESIIAGGKLYKDFIDVKPPLLYYIFAGIRVIFGDGEFAIRYADVLWQIFTIGILVIVTRRLDLSEQTAYVAGLIYSISYVTLGYTSVMHCESFAAPAFVGLLYYQHRGEQRLHYLIMGILLGWIVALKFTLAITIVPLVVFDLITRRYSFTLFAKKYLFVGIGGIISIGVFCMPLFNAEVRDGFIDLLSYLKFYSSQPAFSAEFIKNALKTLASFFGDYYSLGFVSLFLLGISTAFNNTSTEKIHGLRSNLILFVLLLTIALLGSIVIERKFLPNHYVRLYSILTIVVSMGAVTLYQQLKTQWTNNTTVQKSIVFCVAIIAIGFTPLPRLVKIYTITYGYFFAPSVYHSQYNQDTVFGMEEFQRNNVLRYLTQHKRTHDKTLVIGIGESQLYKALHEPTWTVFGHSQFYFSGFTPQWWKARFHKEVTIANWILVSTNDVYPFLNGHDRSSWESLQQDTTIFPYFTQHFTPKLSQRSMTLYQRTAFDSTNVNK